MKTRAIIGTVVGGLILLAVIFFGIREAFGQTPSAYPDIPMTCSGDICTFRCQPVEPIDNMNQMCAVRIWNATLEMEPTELGCVPSTTLDIVAMEVTIENTPFQDAEVRCYATDTFGNASDYSANAGTRDFTPPGVPHVR